MADELNNEQRKGGFLENIKKNIVGYTVTAALAVGATLLLSDRSSQEPYPANGNPRDILNFKEISQLYYGYDSRAEIIEDTVRQSIPDFDAARSVSFDYQDFKNYLVFIENNSVEANIRISELRFYFGKYPNDTTLETKGRQMLFFNPTVDTLIDDKRLNLAYAIDRQGSKVGIKLLKDLVQRPKSNVSNPPKATGEKAYIINEASALSFLNFSTDDQLESQGKNGGQQSPPPYDFQ